MPIMTSIIPLVLRSAPPKESPTGITGNGSIVEMGGGRISTHTTLFSELD